MELMLDHINPKSLFLKVCSYLNKIGYSNYVENGNSTYLRLQGKFGSDLPSEGYVHLDHLKGNVLTLSVVQLGYINLDKELPIKEYKDVAEYGSLSDKEDTLDSIEGTYDTVPEILAYAINDSGYVHTIKIDLSDTFPDINEVIKEIAYEISTYVDRLSRDVEDVLDTAYGLLDTWTHKIKASYKG